MDTMQTKNEKHKTKKPQNQKTPNPKTNAHVTYFAIIPQSWGKLNFWEKNGPCPPLSLTGRGNGYKEYLLIVIVMQLY